VELTNTRSRWSGVRITTPARALSARPLGLEHRFAALIGGLCASSARADILRHLPSAEELALPAHSAKTGEAFSYGGRKETQHQVAIAVGEAHPDADRAEQVARAKDYGLTADIPTVGTELPPLPGMSFSVAPSWVIGHQTVNLELPTCPGLWGRVGGHHGVDRAR
jgi:hypothetical protein